MLTFITLVLVAALAWFVGAVVYDNSEFVAGLCGAIFIVDVIVLIVAPCTLINRNTRFEYVIEQYNNVNDMVSDYNSLPDSATNKIESLESDIRREILNINSIVSEHKVKSQSLWVGPWYSKEIGDLPKLSINGKR